MDLGSSHFITNLEFEIAEHLEYVPFGEVFIEEGNGSFSTPYLYNGKELDPETGYYYYGARYYNPRVSQWLSVDPLAEKYPSWSPYAYTFNNPIRFIDPDGLEAEDTDPIGPGYYLASINLRYIGFGIRHPIASIRIGFGVVKGASNISTNATRFATRGEILYGSKKGQRDEGSENGAFRHALWQASITSEFGSKIAKEAGNAHEKNPFADLSIRNFKKLSEADQTIDLLNNTIGRSIGNTNSGSDMAKLASLVLNEFKNNGLYTATKDKEGNWNVSKTKLSSEKYEQLKRIFKGLDNNGRTIFEQKVLDDKAKIKVQTWNKGPKW